jgi:hypothetical protein
MPFLRIAALVFFVAGCGPAASTSAPASPADSAAPAIVVVCRREGHWLQARGLGASDLALDRDDGRTIVLRGAMHRLGGGGAWATPEIGPISLDGEEYEVVFPEPGWTVRWRATRLEFRGKTHDVAKRWTYVLGPDGGLEGLPR